MTGRHAGVVTLLENECSNPVLRIWCVLHQLDIVVKNATHGVLDEAFYNIAHAFFVLSKSSSPKWVPSAQRTRRGGSHSAIFYAGFWNIVVD